MHRYLLHNGSIRDIDEPLLSPGQVGFMNGWGVFSTLRVSEGVLFAYERHYQRMRRDAEVLHVPFDITPEGLEEQLLKLVEANHALNATLRVAVVRNKGNLFESPGITRLADLVAFTADLTNWSAGVKLGYMPNARFSASPFAATKVTSWAENLTWYETAHERGFDEFILLNESGAVSECTSANIFVIQGDHVWTPPVATSGCLPGVTRAILLEEMRVPRLTISERNLTRFDLEKADQVFISSSTRDLLPVSEIEGVPLRQDGTVLARLQEAFVENRKKYIQANASRKALAL
ncbi:MAG: aminotransferase class IV [Acidobacteriaceae bacterium]|nr:aminotransferase class IV [Acidobacteriaceae bacterium]